MSDVPDIHDVLHWANRTLVAEEVTRRGFRVSGESMSLRLIIATLTPSRDRLAVRFSTNHIALSEL
jgi:hypothetical protein